MLTKILLFLLCLCMADVVEFPDHVISVDTVGNFGFRVGISYDVSNSKTIPTTMVEVDPSIPKSDMRVTKTKDAVEFAADFGGIHIGLNGSFYMVGTCHEIVKSDTLVSMNSGGLTVQLDQSDEAKYYGSGGNLLSDIDMAVTSATPFVGNRVFFTPAYYSTDGYSVLVVTEIEYDAKTNSHYTANWNAEKGMVEWSIQGIRVDLYFLPSESISSGMKNLLKLTGRPRVLPKYAFGFLICRWGWKDNTYVEDTLSHFRSGKFPVDAWISDFEWYTAVLDYNIPPTGSPTYVDFAYNDHIFPDPKNQIKMYKEKYNMYFGGIRKPRLANTSKLEMAHEKGWIAPNSKNFHFNYSDARQWYSEQNRHYLEDGVRFWWNDEGDYEFFAFHYWNQAEYDLLKSFDSNRRFFSINRAFTPGMQKYGTATWTGDVGSKWENLAGHPKLIVNWAMSGSVYVTCDTGGFRGDKGVKNFGELLIRWVNLAVFMPVMRIHSTNSDTPHWPWLFGSEVESAYRSALNFRYRLIPYIYSLAHIQYREYESMIRPLAYEYENEDTMNSQYLLGFGLMVAPIVNSGGNVDVYLPEDTWYDFNDNSVMIQGPATQKISNATLDYIPLFIRAGTILPLAPEGMQYTSDAITGPLEVMIWAGESNSFELTEDDGETYGYETNKVRITAFRWDDGSKTLEWTRVTDEYSGEGLYTQIKATLRMKGHSTTSKTVTFGSKGTLTFDKKGPITF